MSDLYFGYGSNLDADDWAAFCAARDFDPGVLMPVGPATLHDEILVFDYLSLRRRCGALNIRAQPGGRVDGYLFAVAPSGWDVLDAKEGHPFAYLRERIVIVAPGGRIAAQTYRVIPARRGAFCAPNPAYLTACRRGRARFGLATDQLEAAAVGEPSLSKEGGSAKSHADP